MSNAASREAIGVFASVLAADDVCTLDETYASKAFAALLHDVRHATPAECGGTAFVFCVTCNSALPPPGLADIHVSKLPPLVIEKFF
jgi:hypothetical protein